MNDASVKREITDLKMKDQSYNEIIDHLQHVHGIQVTKHDISDVIIEAGKRANFLNGIHDHHVKSRFCVIEIDEVFQGRLSCYIAVVDKDSQYVFRLVHIKNRSRESFEKVFKEIAGEFKNLKVIITDGFSMYRTLIPEHFDDVYHALCHVHALRQFYRELDEYKNKAKKALKALNDARDSLNAAINTRDAKQRQLRAMQSRVARCIQEMDAYRARHGIKKWQRGVQWTVERLKLKDQLGSARASLRSKKQTVVNKKKKVREIRAEIHDLETKYKEKWQAAMQSGRVVSWFHDLLSKPPGDFSRIRDELVAKLTRSDYQIAKTLLKYINSHPELKPIPGIELDKMDRGFNWSTNMVESFFSTIRALLNKAKRFDDSETSKALLEILRLKHNTTRPKSGINRHVSPLERAGSRTRFDHYLDALFPGMESSQDVMEITCRHVHDEKGGPIKVVLRSCTRDRQFRQIQQMYWMPAEKIREIPVS